MDENTTLWRALDVERETAIALVVAPLLLALIHFAARPSVFSRMALGQGLSDQEGALAGLLWWAGWSVIAYFAVPAALIKVRRGRLADYGLRLPQWRPYLFVYPLMYVVVLLPMFAVARDDAFLRTYPLYKHAAERPELWALFHVGYAAQFFALEFFFRGYLLFAIRRSFGEAAVLVSALPYCMIHFSKPVPEALGSLVAGIMLGALALRTGSIVGGVAVHYAVALTMDLLALATKAGRL